MSLVGRAAQDIQIRKAILQGVGSKVAQVITVPTMTVDKLQFWMWLADRFGVTVEWVQNYRTSLGEYQFNKGAVLLFSHGLESSVIRYMWPTLPILTINPEEDWTDPVEGHLAIIAAGNGYHTAIFGGEVTPGGTVAGENFEAVYFTESTIDFQIRWAQYSGAQFLSPLAPFNKQEVLRIAVREHVWFNSCHQFTGDLTRWCGRCAKCKEVHALFQAIKQTPPFQLT